MMSGRRGLVALMLVASVLATRPALAEGGRGRGQTAPALTGVVVTPDGAFVQVSLHGSAPLPAVAPARTTEGPPRLFVDLPGVLLGDVPARIAGAGPVLRVRAAQNSLDPPVTRVVLDLAGDVTFGVVPSGPATNDITIAVATAGAGSTPAAVQVPPPAPGRAASTPSATSPKAPATVALPPRTAQSPTPVRPQPAPAPRAPVAPATNAPASLTSPATPVAAGIAAAAPTSTSTAGPTTPSAPPAGTSSAAASTAPTATPSSAGTTMPVQTTPSAPRPVGGFGMGRTAKPTGRVSFYASGAHATQTDGFSTTYGDFMTAVSYSYLDRTTDGVEYGLDMRHTAYTIEGRSPRVSIYNGFVGARLADGHANVRAGHLWIDDLGGLGSLAGAQLEGRSGEIPTSGLGRWRAGVFGGLDPNLYSFGYGDGIRKLGGYAVLEGARGRRHVAGYVNVHNGDMTERSVLSFANFVPAGPFFAYQVAEYDLSPIAGGLGHDGLTYFFTNMRYSIGRRLELQGTVSRGRSVDARGLSDDIQAGRPVTQQSVDGLLYQSYGGRVTGEVLPRVRVYVGYSRDKNNRDDAPTGRWLSGGYATDVFGSGLDLTATDSRITRPTGTYHSTYLSAGRQIGSRIYATTEFSTALSLVRFVRGDGIVVESRPSTKRFGGNATIQLWRATSVFLNLERTLDNDDYREWRALSGLTVRLR